LLVVMIWLELCTTYSSSSPDITATSIILCLPLKRREMYRMLRCSTGVGEPTQKGVMPFPLQEL